MFAETKESRVFGVGGSKKMGAFWQLTATFAACHAVAWLSNGLGSHGMG